MPEARAPLQAVARAGVRRHAVRVTSPRRTPAVIYEARPPLLAALTGVGRALWQLVSRRAGLLLLFLMLMPIGSGGAQQLWAAIAGDWHASATQVALVNGALGGVVSLIGCVAGGALCDRLDRKTAYCLYGLALGVTAVAMAVLPRTSTTFVVMTLVYAFVLGTCYAAYTAVVLEEIGTTAAATKFQLLSAPPTYRSRPSPAGIGGYTTGGAPAGCCGARRRSAPQRRAVRVDCGGHVRARPDAGAGLAGRAIVLVLHLQISAARL